MRLPPYRRLAQSQCRQSSTAASAQLVPILPNSSLETFREAYNAGTPVLLPRQALISLPGIRKWFISTRTPSEINAHYLARFGACPVPLEFTYGGNFARITQPLSYFLECLVASHSPPIERPRRFFSSYTPGAKAVHLTKQENSFFNKVAPTLPQTQVYLAQARITDLPRGLRADVPVPDLVTGAGKGDVYDSSIWIGKPPTYTPLHRDPNSNLFVQLAGTKVIRLFRPDVGRGIFAKVQESIGAEGSHTIRGEEMMQGAERIALEKEVWATDSDSTSKAYEAHLGIGDALLIPKGWWHSVKSTGSDINGSVNWWFR